MVSLSAAGVTAKLKVMEGKAIAREPIPNPALARELRRIAQRPNRNCLIGIPTLDPAGPHFENFLLYRARLLKYFNSRTGHQVRLLAHHAARLRPVDRDAGVRRCAGRHLGQEARSSWWWRSSAASLLQYVRMTHPTPPLHVVCPRHGAYGEIDRLERQVLALMPDIVLLSCGPTATVLAHRLCVAGLQAHRLGQRRWLSAALAREWPAAGQ